jgi:hypothetical protein
MQLPMVQSPAGRESSEGPTAVPVRDVLGAHRKLVGAYSPLKKPCFRIAEINIRRSPFHRRAPRVRSNHEPNPRRSRWLPK